MFSQQFNYKCIYQNTQKGSAEGSVTLSWMPGQMQSGDLEFNFNILVLDENSRNIEFLTKYLKECEKDSHGGGNCWD